MDRVSKPISANCSIAMSTVGADGHISPMQKDSSEGRCGLTPRPMELFIYASAENLCNM